MTIEELYEWAKENECEDYTLEVCGDATTEVNAYNVVVDRKYKTVTVPTYC